MKKFLIATCIFSVAMASSAYAAQTYTEQFIQKHTQKVVDKEKELQKQQKAREDAIKKQQLERQKRYEARQKQLEEQKKARDKAILEQQKKIQKKKDAWNTLLGK